MNTRTPSEARPPRMEALARMPVFKLLTRALIVALIALPLSPMAKADPPVAEALAAFSKFFPAFVARNHAAVAAMFAPDALFYGTASPELVTKPEGVLQYFTAALDRPDITQATPLQLTFYNLTDGVVLIAGTWKVDRTLDGKTTVGEPLRVSAVLQKRNDRWLIVQFHDSPRPAPPPPQPAPAR